MEKAGMHSSTDMVQAINAINETRKLLELQGELVIELIRSASVPGPSDLSVSEGLGTGIDLHV